MKRKAFTLIELLVSVVIIALISVAVYSAFNVGLKTWRGAHGRRSLQKIRLALLKINKELKRTFFFSRIPFKGTHDDMIFPLSMVDGNVESIYTISYFVNRDNHAGLKQLVRKETLFSENIKERRGDVRRLTPLMKDIRFEYAYRKRNSSEGIEWYDSWDGEEQDGLPSGVRISLRNNDTGGLYNKVIFLQHGELGEW